jgi:hypothetical protein
VIMDARIEGEYRYLLQRTWNGFARLLIIMLNPSTADALKNDPTLLRCIHFAQTWGFGGIDVVNPFALRSPSPSVLCVHANPIGPRCDEYIMWGLNTTGAYLLAWGNPPDEPDGPLAQRIKIVERQALQRAKERGVPVYCLGRTKSGHPKHPLARGAHRVPNDQRPILYGALV